MLVFGTDIESAAKARALSQCLGSLAAAVVALAIFPWFAVPSAEQALSGFHEEMNRLLRKNDPNVAAGKEETIESGGAKGKMHKMQNEFCQ